MTTEYQEVAALLAMDIDILARIVDSDSHDADTLRQYIMQLKQQKDQIITDEKYRKMRYDATSAIMNLPRAPE